MIHLPSIFRSPYLVVLAGVLSLSAAQATRVDEINARLVSLYGPGKTIQNASAGQLQTATWQALAVDATTRANAGLYLQDVLVLRGDRNKIASGLTTGALVYAGAFPADGTNPSQLALTGTIAGQVTAKVVTDAGLTVDTVTKISKDLILKSRLAAYDIGASVGANLATAADTTAYAVSVLPGISKAGNDAIGAFCAGASTQVFVPGTNTLAWFSFSQKVIAKAPDATAQILYSEIALTGSLSAGRIAESGTLAAVVSNGVSSSRKGSIAKGIIQASGTANTVNIIQTILATNPNISGQAITTGGVNAFTSSAAGAVVNLAKDSSKLAEATAIMRLITNTIANSLFAPKVGELSAPLNESQKAQLANSAVKVAPDTPDQFNNPANAAIVGVLNTMPGLSLSSASAFAITASKSVSPNNAGQVANAVANYLTPSSTLTPGTAAPANYVAISGSMIKANSKNATEISRRVAQLIPPNLTGVNQAARVNLATQLATSFSNSAQAIAVGVSYTDPQYADDITAAVVAATSNTRKDAAKIAGAVANIGPSEEACEISRALGALIKSRTLDVRDASEIAESIAKSTYVKNNQEELQVVAAQMIQQLMGLFTTSTIDPIKLDLNQKIIDAVADVAKSVAKVSFTNNANKNAVLPPVGDPSYQSQLALLCGFANEIAGSATQAALVSTLTSDEKNALGFAIAKGVMDVTNNSTTDAAVGQAVQNVVNPNPSVPVTYAINCNVNEQETPTTNF